MRVVFLDDYQGAAERLAPLHRLRDADVAIIREHLVGDGLIAALRGADVAVAMRERTTFDRAVFARLPELRLLCTTGTRNAAIDLDAAREHGVLVCATDGHASANTAEHTWALILALARNLPSEVASVRSGGWQRGIGIDLDGTTLGLVGLGRIGSRVAQIGQAFGMKVVAWSQNLTVERAAPLGVEAVSKGELFARADVISIHLVLSERSRGIVTETNLRAMKPTALLVNTARGPIVDETALRSALTEGWISGAGIDVFSDEPLPPDDPLRSNPRALLTPHIGYVTTNTLTRWYADVIDNILAWQAAAPIRMLNTLDDG